MAAPFVEVTLVNITHGAVSPAGKKTIGTAHIVAITEGQQGTGHITLSNGERLNVQETYAALKIVLEA
jgi:hypothetical protein